MHTFICMQAYLHEHAFRQIHMHSHAQTWIHTNAQSHAYIHIHVHMHTHTATCISLYTCAAIQKHLHIHSFTHNFRCIHYHSGACIHTHSNLHTCTCSHFDTHVHWNSNTCGICHVYRCISKGMWERDRLRLGHSIRPSSSCLPVFLYSNMCNYIQSLVLMRCSTSMSQWRRKKAQGYADPLAYTLSSSRPFHYLAFIQTCIVCGSCTGSVRCTGRRNDQRLSWPLIVIKRACTQKPCLYLSQTI